MSGLLPQHGEILLYDNGADKQFVSVVFKDETFWLTQSGMAELFDCSADNISLHLKNIYADGELEQAATTEKFSVVRKEGSREVRRSIDHYDLDAIIAVGYRVNSKKATRFRQWATKTLKEYIQKGFVLNDEMMKNGRPFGKDYFDELLERIREIRASERRAYQKIADVFEQCSYDYDKNSETTKAFYAFVQNKLHYAVTGKTAAELISERATLDSPTMGLTTWKGAPDGKILKSDTLVAKNYLNEKELSRLNRLVTMFIDYAELMAEDEQLMSMQDWLDETDRFLTNNRRKVLEGKGRISREAAVKKVGTIIIKSTYNRRERPVHGHRDGARGRFYYRITTFEGRPWDARDPYKTTFMALKHEIRLSIWRKQKETPGVEKAPGVSSPQRKESGRSGRDDGELRFWVRPGHPYKAVTSISQAEALAHGLTHLHHLVFAAVLARELDWCAALQDAREDARPWGVVGIGLRSDVWVEVRRDDHRPAVLVT